MAIKVLPPETVMLIAAGEVISRPADVVKELVENAIDAIMARHRDAAPGGFPLGRVQVEIVAGGSELIRVTDNGCGIASDDLPLAFERHATSKISAAPDLQSVATLGFRGEALASIAAVSHVNVVTRAQGEDAGSFMALVGGETVEQGKRAWQEGTSIAVRNLFFNTPARRRFLRSNASESGQIAHLLCQFALAHPGIQFTLQVDGRVSFSAPGNGKLAEAIAAVYGPDTLRQMTEVVPEEVIFGEDPPAVTVSGFVGQPSLTYPNRTRISLFVNDRWVQNRALVFAVGEAYRDLLPPGRHPVGVLKLKARPEELDVNVHPTKAEVRFARERQVFVDVQRAVRGALAAEVPIRQFTSTPPVVAPPTSTWSWPGEQASSPAGQQAEMALPDTPGESRPAAQTETAQRPVTAGGRRLPIMRVVGQVGSAFIIAEAPEGLYLIDQHRAHERVLFDRFMAAQKAGERDAQLLLEPLPLELAPRQAAALVERIPALQELGLQLEPFGERTVLVRAVPASLKATNLRDTLLEIIEEVLEEKPGENWRERATTTLACHSAVRAGQTLSLEEMRQLILQLEASTLPLTCPHGAPTMIHLSQAQLEKEFLRR